MSEKGKKLAGIAGMAGGLGSTGRGDQSATPAPEEKDPKEIEGTEGEKAAMEEFHKAMTNKNFSAMSAALKSHGTIAKSGNT